MAVGPQTLVTWMQGATQTVQLALLVAKTVVKPLAGFVKATPRHVVAANVKVKPEAFGTVSETVMLFKVMSPSLVTNPVKLIGWPYGEEPESGGGQVLTHCLLIER